MPDIHIAIISARRPSAVAALAALGITGHWYVASGDGPAYRDAGAKNVIEAGPLVPARNLALDTAFALGVPCMQLSDDLLNINEWAGGKTVRPLPFPDLLTLMASFLHSECRLVGVAPTANTFYAAHKVQHAHFILGDMFIASPSPLRFDERLRLKEDYDYTCQHIAKYGQVARLDWVLANFKHRSNKGGAVGYRTASLEQESIDLLRSKWPAWIKPNPRRPNEVLLRVPRSTYVT